MANYPAHGTPNWDDDLQAYIESLPTSAGPFRDDLLASTAVAVKQTVNMVFDGDSLTAGSTLEPAFNFPRQVSDGVANATVTNLGVHGQTVIEMASDATTQVDPLYDSTPGVLNVLIVWCGTNDMALNGATAAATHTALRNYCLARRAAGFKVVVLTTIPRDDPDLVQRPAYNTLIRNNWTAYADALVDTDTDAVFGAPSSVNLPRFYRFEKTHLTRAGMARIAALVKPVLNRLGVTTAQDQGMKQEGVSDLFVPASAFRPTTGVPIWSDQYGELDAWRLPKTAALIDRLTTSVRLPADWTTKPIVRIRFAGVGGGSGGPYWFLSVRGHREGGTIYGADGVDAGSSAFHNNSAGDGNITRAVPDGAFWPQSSPNVTLRHNLSLARYTDAGAADSFAGTVLFLGVELISGDGTAT